MLRIKSSIYVTGPVNLKSQYPMAETKCLGKSDSALALIFMFRISNFGHWVLFVIFYLVLGVFQLKVSRN